MKTKTKGLYKNIKSPLIIKLLLPCLLFLFSFTQVKRTFKAKLPLIRKEMKIDNPFQTVCINGDISLILTNEPAGTFMVEGTEDIVNNLRYKVKNNELTIYVRRKSRLHNLTVYLSAATLKSMLLNGDANVSSTGIIKSDNLQIWMNGIITVNVKTTGKISIDASDAYEVFWDGPLKHQ